MTNSVQIITVVLCTAVDSSEDSHVTGACDALLTNSDVDDKPIADETQNESTLKKKSKKKSK